MPRETFFNGLADPPPFVWLENPGFALIYISLTLWPLTLGQVCRFSVLRPTLTNLDGSKP